MHEYTVIMGYIGECCADSHVWVQAVRARTPARAIQAMRLRIEREGNDPQDCVIFDGRLPMPRIVGRNETPDEDSPYAPMLGALLPR